MDIQEFFDVSYYSFPKVTRDIRYKLTTLSEQKNELLKAISQERDIMQNNMDLLTALLSEKEIVRALEACEKAPTAYPESHDLYVLFRCYQYAVWNLPWNKDDMLEEWKKLNPPESLGITHNVNEIYSAYLRHMNESDPENIVSYLIDTLSRRITAKACFVITDCFTMQECVLCDNKHDAMMYQLLLYLAYPEQARNGREIKYCKECGEAFIRSSRRAEYCPKHSTGSARVMRHRREQAAKKKED